MLRTPLTHLLILALLFISIEGAVDSVGGEHPHGDEHTHHISHDAGVSTDLSLSNTPTDNLDDNPGVSFNNTLTSDNSDSEHCQHCCHGHTSSISAYHFSNISCHQSHPLFSFFQPQLFSLIQAPPTRPPNV